ncbi:MAG: hypothetical protein DWQ19_11770 [Crenarchaeota archaeon]|nr:MAG: hypothetical protein DWQ19_11770 [Thermoproteota archaeon]
MIPLKEELIPYKNDINGAAVAFGKSTRTIRRWLERYDLYCPKKEYRPGKTTREMIRKIKQLDLEGLTQSKISEIVGISQPMVGKIINRGLFKLKGKAEISFTKMAS